MWPLKDDTAILWQVIMEMIMLFHYLHAVLSAHHKGTVQKHTKNLYLLSQYLSKGYGIFFYIFIFLI